MLYYNTRGLADEDGLVEFEEELKKSKMEYSSESFRSKEGEERGANSKRKR